MKKITNKDRDCIKRWDDIPLSKNDLIKRKVKDLTKSIEFLYESTICVEGDSLTWLKKLINNPSTEKIFIDIELDHDYVESVEIRSCENSKDLWREETDSEYEFRLDEMKKSEWEILKIVRKNIEEGERDDYKEFLRLSKKYNSNGKKKI